MQLRDRSTRAGAQVRGRMPVLLSAALATALGGLAAPGALTAERESAIRRDPSQYNVVDCLLPGQVRKLGGQMTYLSPRRPVKTTQSDCEIRGGEYVAYDRANYATALAIWQPTAEGGDAQAQTYVGEIYEKGLGRPVDFAEAAKWYQKAADQNYTRAQLNLAYLYEQGLGVEKDPLKALNLYRQGAGIKDDSLTYLSEVTAVRSELQAEIDALTEQLEKQNTEIERLERDLESSQSQVGAQRGALERAQAEARGLRDQVTQLQATAGSDPAKAEELRRLEEELRRREQRVLQDERAVARLEADNAAQRSRLADELKSAAEKDLEMRRQLTQATAQRDELQEKLVQTQRKLLDTEQQAARLRSELATERARIAADREQFAKQSAAPGADAAGRQAAAAALAERERRLAAQQAQIARLLQQQREYTAELTRLRAEQQARGQAQQQQQAEVASVRSELASARRRLVETQQRVNDLTAQLKAEQSRIAAEREQLNRRAASAAGAQQAEVERLRQALAQREADLQKQSALIAQLEQEARNYQAQIRRMQSTPPVEQVATRGVAPVATPAPASARLANVPPELRSRRYYALVIGNNRYANHPTLKTAVADAEAVDRVLRTRYGFATRLLLDATAADIGEAIDGFKQLQPDDSLLIYYAGHGQLDTESGRGYWLPVDAPAQSSQEWISDREIADWVDQIRARHVLVVADSCYSGVLTRDSRVGFKAAPTPEEQARRLLLLAKQKSRTVLTSGTDDQPVPDAGPGGHSVFAKVFMEVLESNPGVLEGRVLYGMMFQQVRRRSPLPDQSPRYDAIRQAGHGVGDFLFIRRS